MMTQEHNFKVGQYVQWRGSRYMTTWDVPCRVTEIHPEDEFKRVRISVQTFDDMKTTSVDLKTANEEMRAINAIDAYRYVLSKIALRKGSIAELEAKIEQKKLEIIECKELCNELYPAGVE